ncbi:7738_t:CDS:2, partial [Funneliformis mosseae]
CDTDNWKVFQLMLVDQPGKSFLASPYISCQRPVLIEGSRKNRSTYYNLLLPPATDRSPDASVVLATRWNALSSNDLNEKSPSVVPNFVEKVRSANDTENYNHEKICFYMEAGVKEDILIDPINQNVTIYRAHGNEIVWNVLRNPRTTTSRILNGFVLNLRALEVLQWKYFAVNQEAAKEAAYKNLSNIIKSSEMHERTLQVAVMAPNVFYVKSNENAQMEIKRRIFSITDRCTSVAKGIHSTTLS